MYMHVNSSIFFSQHTVNKMVLLYEAAAKKYPSNEEILTQLYMAYVRIDDYDQQQKVWHNVIDYSECMGLF